MSKLARRVDALDRKRRFFDIGELLDHLDGEPLPAGKMVSPDMRQAIEALPRA